MQPIEFGDWVLVHANLIRRKREVDKKTINTWERVPLRVPFEAIFLGKRILSDCEWHWEYESYPNEGSYLEMYNSNRQVGAIVCQKNRKPIKVLFADLERIKDPWERKIERFATQAVEILRQV